MNEQILGLVTGVAFGFLLQKGRVLRLDKQVAAMRLKDMTILKFMLAAILVGTVGLHLLAHFDVLAFKHKPMNLGAVGLGGILFGAGWAVMGFCPGTSVGALGEGRWHAGPARTLGKLGWRGKVFFGRIVSCDILLHERILYAGDRCSGCGQPAAVLR